MCLLSAGFKDHYRSVGPGICEIPESFPSSVETVDSPGLKMNEVNLPYLCVCSSMVQHLCSDYQSGYLTAVSHTQLYRAENASLVLKQHLIPGRLFSTGHLQDMEQLQPAGSRCNGVCPVLMSWHQ